MHRGRFRELYIVYGGQESQKILKASTYVKRGNQTKLSICQKQYKIIDILNLNSSDYSYRVRQQILVPEFFRKII